MSSALRPRATFLVLAYNQENYVREAIEGAFAQRCSSLEILLSDDASSDGTYQVMLEMAAAYSGPHKVRTRRSSKNSGFIAHLRAAVTEATADVVILAAGDDVSFPDRSERTLTAFERDPATMAVFSDISLAGRPAAVATHAAYVETKAFDMLLGAGGVGKGATYAYRKVCFSWPTELDDRFRSEDRVLPLRAAILGRVFHYTAPLISYRDHPNNMSNLLAQQGDQAHQSRAHWRMTRDTLKVARQEGRMSICQYLALDGVCLVAMCSRLVEVRRALSGSLMPAIVAWGLLLPLRLLQRLQRRIRFN